MNNKFSNNYKSIIVLDIDETIVSSSLYKNQDLSNITEEYMVLNIMTMKNNEIKWDDIISVKRPNLRKFLLFCRLNFDYVCVWTAGTKEYASIIVNNFFPYTPYLVWDRSKIDINPDGIRYKDLLKLKNHIKSETGENVKTFMVDDIEINCTNSDYCYIIEKFNQTDQNDNGLDKLIEHIKSVEIL